MSEQQDMVERRLASALQWLSSLAPEDVDVDEVHAVVCAIESAAAELTALRERVGRLEGACKVALSDFERHGFECFCASDPKYENPCGPCQLCAALAPTPPAKEKPCSRESGASYSDTSTAQPKSSGSTEPQPTPASDAARSSPHSAMRKALEESNEILWRVPIDSPLATDARRQIAENTMQMNAAATCPPHDYRYAGPSPGLDRWRCSRCGKEVFSYDDPNIPAKENPCSGESGASCSATTEGAGGSDSTSQPQNCSPSPSASTTRIPEPPTTSADGTTTPLADAAATPDPRVLVEAESGLTFAHLASVSAERAKVWHNGTTPPLSFRLMEMAGEAGEACNEGKKLARAEMGMVGGTTDKGPLARELADVVITADLVATQAGIDLEQAVIDKFNATSEKHGFSHRLNALAAWKEQR